MTTSDQTPKRARNGRGRFVRHIDTAQRDADACRLRSNGATYQEIADQLGYPDRQAARTAVTRALREIVAEPAAELRTLELARLDRMWNVAWRILEDQHVTVSQGRVVHTDDGQPVADVGPVLAAIDRLLKIQERRARLLGLDAPTRVQVTPDEVEQEIARLTAALGLNDPTPGGLR